MTDQSSETETKPRVVIDWHPNGDHTVYADGDVDVYCRSAHTERDPLYRYTPEPIPDGWLDEDAGYLGDGSIAERRLTIYLTR